jgi:hypothetical protein
MINVNLDLSNILIKMIEKPEILGLVMVFIIILFIILITFFIFYKLLTR